jgi:mono/diheme cytochrome c family protein
MRRRDRVEVRALGIRGASPVRWLLASFVVLALALTGCAVKPPASETAEGETTVAPVPEAVKNLDAAKMTLGQRIYWLGEDASGTIVFTGGTQLQREGQNAACANCHGSGDGITGPDITHATLTATQDEEGKPRAPFTDALIVRAIIKGQDEKGEALDGAMPRFQMNDADTKALLEYLKTL